MNEVEVLDMNETEKKKSKLGSIVILVAIVIVCLVGGYLLFNNGQSNKSLENKFKVASANYFEKYMRTNDSTSVYLVTLDMLKKANELGESYDLSGFENCDGQSTLSKITVNYKNGKAKTVEVELKC